MRRGLIFLLCAFFLNACKKDASFEAHACYGEYMCTADGSIVKWNTSSVRFRYEDTTPEKLRVSISSSALQYNNTLNGVELLVDTKDDSAPKYKNDYSALNRDNINGIYYVEGNWPWATRIPGSLAVTLTRYTADGIIEADIFVKANDSVYKDSPADEGVSWMNYISQHELGHALGRSHSKEKSSLMYPSVSDSKILRLSSAEDFINFFSEYDVNVFNLAYK